MEKFSTARFTQVGDFKIFLMFLRVLGEPSVVHHGDASVKQPIFNTANNICGYIDVCDGCWRPFVLMTTLRCW